MSDIENILDMARWAPSGDNTQPWRFVISAPDRFAIHAHDTRTHCVYDLDGHASQISVGALLETVGIAATRFGLRANIAHRAGSPAEALIFDVSLERVPELVPDALADQITTRSVQRRSLERRALAPHEKETLEQAVMPAFRLRWFEGRHGRRQIAFLNFRNAKLRLTLPEAYETHRAVIAWNCTFSEDRIPSEALGAGPPALRTMRWAMRSWNRVAFLNRYLAGTLAPRIELDLLPGLACAAHVALVAHREPETFADYVHAGRALQRFWLTATALSLQFQPGYTPLVFARYARERRRFSADERALQKASRIRTSLDEILGSDEARQTVFLGRIGHGPAARSRSMRLPLAKLLARNDELEHRA